MTPENTNLVHPLDSGANDLQNFPVMVQVSFFEPDERSKTIARVLNSNPNFIFCIAYYAADKLRISFWIRQTSGSAACDYG